MFTAAAYNLIQHIVSAFQQNPPTPEQRDRLDEWAVALRSGSFKQTREVLHSQDGGMCCLGVACHLTDPNNWVLRRAEHAHTFDGVEDMPPLRVVERFGLVHGGVGSIPDMFAALNDTHHFTFEEIAEVIRLVLERT